MKKSRCPNTMWIAKKFGPKQEEEKGVSSGDGGAARDT